MRVLLALALLLAAATPALAADLSCVTQKAGANGHIRISLTVSDSGVLRAGSMSWEPLSRSGEKFPLLSISYPLLDPVRGFATKPRALVVSHFVMFRPFSRARTATVMVVSADGPSASRPWKLFAQAVAARGRLGDASPDSDSVGLFGTVPFPREGLGVDRLLRVIERGSARLHVLIRGNDGSTLGQELYVLDPQKRDAVLAEAQAWVKETLADVRGRCGPPTPDQEAQSR